jgi:hypothetical protein
VKRIGIGSGDMLRGKDLTPPAGSGKDPPAAPGRWKIELALSTFHRFTPV